MLCDDGRAYDSLREIRVLRVHGQRTRLLSSRSYVRGGTTLYPSCRNDFYKLGVSDRLLSLPSFGWMLQEWLGMWRGCLLLCDSAGDYDHDADIDDDIWDGNCDRN
jgi:hypothetical protein